MEIWLAAPWLHELKGLTSMVGVQFGGYGRILVFPIASSVRKLESTHYGPIWQRVKQWVGRGLAPL